MNAKRDSGSAATTPPREVPHRLHPGESTAVASNVAYRLGKLRRRGEVIGRWLDCGCADGGYTVSLARLGAAAVTGVEVLPHRVIEARRRSAGVPNVDFVVGESENLPFRDEQFDGVLLNEVLEHVADEQQTLREIYRVLRPGGHLALFSPNRWFPFEGHGLSIRGWDLGFPVPWIPWLPASLTAPYRLARNYWPHELRRLVAEAGFVIEEETSVFPVLEVYPWLPGALIPLFRRAVPYLERIPFIRRFGVSTFILARR
jgi:SAM-dependent methyltransferase